MRIFDDISDTYFLCMRKPIFWFAFLGTALVISWLVSGLTFREREEVPEFSFETINGISLVAPVHALEETVFTDLKQINSTWISLMPYAFFRPENPIIRFDSPRQWWGEKTEGIIASIQSAKKHQLKVMLKPHLWISHGGYTGDFALEKEEDWNLWEQSYRDYTLHFAGIADSMQVEMFCIGTELGKAISERKSFWNELIDSVRAVYKGQLVYAANWDDYADIPFWSRLDAIGIDAYFPLCESKTPDPDVMKVAWKQHIRGMQKLSKKIKKPVIFTEFGYRDADYAAHEPWTESSGVINHLAQANAYEALFQSLEHQTWFKGGFVWKWYVDDFYRRREEPDYTPQGKPAEKIIGKWYGNFWEKD